MKTIEMKAKNVKEAIRLGLEQLGCTDASDVDIQVLEMGSPGIFGMFGKPAVVRLTKKGSDKDLDFEMPKISLDTPAKKAQAPKKDKPAPKPEKPAANVEKTETAKQPVSAEKTEDAAPEADVAVETENGIERPNSDAPAAPKKRHRSRSRKKPANTESQPAAEEKEFSPVVISEPIANEPFTETPEDQLTDTAKDARAFLTTLTEKMGVPAAIAVEETEEQLRMVLSGENMSLLIGRRGDTLDAIQYITSLHINRTREDYLRISLDTENYRAKREEALRKLAVRMAGRCKKSGKRVVLEPMNPYERRILHSALQADPDVTTHSEGEEPYRRVIITLK